MLINVGGVLLFSWWRRRLDATITAGRFWPNPAVQASIVDCQIEHIAVAATGRNRPKADVARRTASQLTRTREELGCYFLSPMGKEFVGFHALAIEPGKTPSHCSF